MNKHPLIRKIYLYLFALIGLTLVTIGAVRLVTLGLKVYVFTRADQFYNYPQPRAIPAPPEKLKDYTASPGEVAQPSQTEIDEYNKNQLATNRQNEAAGAIAMIIVGLPLYLYHWGKVKKDKEENG